jgi:hypothetical protein
MVSRSFACAVDTRGQATLEYVLMLLIVVSSYLFVVRGLMDAGLTQLFLRPIQGDYARAYQFGHPKAEFDGSGGKNHPRFNGNGDNNFRIFLKKPGQ